MFGLLPNFGGNLFEDFRRLEEEMDELFGRWPSPAGIRSVVQGTYPPINVGTTPDAVDVYLSIMIAAPSGSAIFRSVSTSMTSPDVPDRKKWRRQPGTSMKTMSNVN